MVAIISNRHGKVLRLFVIEGFNVCFWSVNHQDYSTFLLYWYSFQSFPLPTQSTYHPFQYKYISIRMNTGDCSAHAFRAKSRTVFTLFHVCFIRYFNNALVLINMNRFALWFRSFKNISHFIGYLVPLFSFLNVRIWYLVYSCQLLPLCYDSHKTTFLHDWTNKEFCRYKDAISSCAF